MTLPPRPQEQIIRVYTVTVSDDPTWVGLPPRVRLNKFASALFLGVLKVLFSDGQAQRLDGDKAAEHDVLPAPVQEREPAIMLRLREKDPQLYARVLGGELEMHEAAFRTGVRHRYFQVLSDPQSLANAIRRRYSTEERVRIAAWLAEPN
jgi:hypothetical protein